MTTPDTAQATATTRSRTWLWFVAGGVYGVLVRVLIHVLANNHGAMSVAFLVGTPVAVGAFAVYGSPAARSSVWRALGEPIWPMTFMLVGCALALLEGSICIAMMSPLFFLLSSLGGLCMHIACRFARTDKLSLCTFAALPLVLLPLDVSPPPDTFHELRESVIVQAPVPTVWANILRAKAIRPDELPGSLAHTIGVPKPMDAENLLTPDGETRFSRWEKGVHFRAHVVQRSEHESITWRYEFGPDAFPTGSMDEHVVLGGRYIDLGDTTFHLKGLPDGSTQLDIVGRYRLSTPVNFYAVPVSTLLGRDFLRMLLGFYKGRSEAAAASAKKA